VHATSSSIASATTSTSERSLRWRVIDIVIAAVLGVATGLIFWFWNTVGYLWFETADAVTPGLGGIATGIWLIGGVIGGLVIRKPGAALLVELIGAVVSMLVGNVWGVSTVYSGIVQGLGAELVFAAFAYRRFGVVVAALAGIGAGVAAWIFEFFTGNIEKGALFNGIYLSTIVVSGALLAGVLGWLLVRALAATGALSRFAAGRDARRDV
jgi:energy-coupling factor transport system substrate-specific component